MKIKFLGLLSLLLIVSMALAACAQAEEAPAAETLDCGVEASAETEGTYQIPATIDGCYNVAFVYVGPHDDGGWTQAHDVGREYVEANVDNVHTAYVELVAEGADAEQVTRSWLEKASM